MVVYKLVQEFEGKLYSWTPHLKTEGMNFRVVEYIPNIETFPKVRNTPLFAYHNLEDGQERYNNLTITSNTQLWEVDSLQVFTLSVEHKADLNWAPKTVDDCLNVWNNWEALGTERKTLFKPKLLNGSKIALCPSLKLIKRII